MKNIKQKGAAIVTALIVTSVIATIATSLLVSYKNTFEKVVMDENYGRGLNYAMFAENFSREILNIDRKKNSYDYYDKNEIWSQTLSQVPIDNAVVSGELEELNGKININNLYIGKTKDQKSLARQQTFKRIIIKLFNNLNIDKLQATHIVNSIIDWIDEDEYITQPGGAEDDAYNNLDASFRTPNFYMGDISEIKLLPTMTQAIWDKIKDCFIALPTSFTPININTAPQAIITALTGNNNQIIQYPGVVSAPTSTVPSSDCNTAGKLKFKALSQFVSVVNRENQNDKLPNFPSEYISAISVQSSFFRLKANVSLDSSNVHLQTLFFRNNKATVTIARNLGIKPTKKPGAEK